MNSPESTMSNSDLKRPRPEPKYTFGRRYDRNKTKRAKPDATPKEETKLDEDVLAYVFDGGAHTIKAGLTNLTEPMVIPNAIMKVKSEKKRLFIGNQIEDCRDLSGLYFLLPCERGYVTKWEVQKPIWDYVFSKNVCPFDDKPVIMTQPLFNFKSIQDCIDEIFFEEYEVKSFYRTNGTDLANLQYVHQTEAKEETCIIVDSGFSFTHIVPYIDGKKYFKAIKRINIGGKFLTNYLRDIISYRMYDVMDETYVINQVKEDATFISQDIKKDLDIAKLHGDKNTIVRNYVLPDFNMIRRGYIQESNVADEVAENCQILRLNNERFTVPELLFQPKDVGMPSIGIAEGIAKTIMLCPKVHQAILAKNIVIIGGNVNIPGFKERLYADVRSLLPDVYKLDVYKPENPVTFSWMGGKMLANDASTKKLFVTKEEYEELGATAVQARFNDWSSIPDEAPPKPTTIKPISYINHIKKYNIFGKNEEVVVEVHSSPEESPSVDRTPDFADSSYSDIFDITSPSSMESEDSSPMSSQKVNEVDEGYCGSSKSSEAKPKGGRSVLKKKPGCKIVLEKQGTLSNEVADIVFAENHVYV